MGTEENQAGRHYVILDYDNIPVLAIFAVCLPYFEFGIVFQLVFNFQPLKLGLSQLALFAYSKDISL